MRLFSSLGRLPRTWWNISIIVVAGFAEGLGIALFVPLLDFMTKGSVEGLKWPFNLIIELFESVGLPVTVISIVVGIAVTMLTSLGFAYAQRLMLVHSRQNYKRRLRVSLVGSLFNANWNRISQVSHGEFVNVLITECDRASTALYHEVMCAAVAVQIATYLLFSTALSWHLVLITLVFGAVIVVTLRPFLRYARRLGGATDRANRDISFNAVDFLKGAKLIKATAAERSVLGHMGRYIGTSFKVAYGVESNAALINFLVQLLPVLLITLIIAVAHKMLGLDASLTLVFLLFLARFAPRVAQFQQSYQAYIVDNSAIRITDDLVAENLKAADRSGGAEFRRLTDRIVFEDLTYRYDADGASIVNGIDLTIRRNEMVGFVGSSGSGKSTLIDMLAGLRQPESGRILVDGIDLADIDLTSWRSRIGYVTQDVIIFNDTLRNNLLFANPDAGDADIDQALHTAHLGELIETLPEGLETVLGEGGVRLSGGQRQRLALARAVIGKPEILLLDEATSSLDNESEQIVQKAIDSLSHDFTIVIVAHRLSTVRKADVIYVLENGRIIEAGSYAKLIAMKGRFADLHDMQFS